jgi:hypothetical protein
MSPTHNPSPVDSEEARSVDIRMMDVVNESDIVLKPPCPLFVSENIVKYLLPCRTRENNLIDSDCIS